MMKTSWKFGLHVHNYVSAGQRGPVGQRNPLRQVMWVSNPLEWIRDPFLSSALFERAQQDLDGPQSQGLSSHKAGWWRAHTMVRWTLTLTHAQPLRLRTQGTTITATQPRCTPQRVDAPRCLGVHAHVHMCVNVPTNFMQMKIFPVCLPQGLWLLPFLQENSLKSPNLDTQSQRTVHFQPSGPLMKRQTVSSLKKYR